MHLIAMYVIKASMKIGTRVNATIEAGAHEVLLTPFIESVKIALHLVARKTAT